MQIKNFKPRLYQETILHSCVKHNCLIILPTGLGKTKTAILVAVNRLNSFPNSKILFLTPTKPLANQICQEFKECTSISDSEIFLFTGAVSPEKREQLWSKAKVVVSTPQGCVNDVINGRIILENISLMVFDEAHRAVGDYDYVFLAKQYHKKSNFPRIIGLTASPGSDLEKITEVSKNLFIENIELRTESDPDVKPYVQELDVDYVTISLPEEFKEVKKFLETCLKSKLQRMKDSGFIASVNYTTKKDILSVQKDLQRRVLGGEKDYNLWTALSLVAEAIKVHHALELFETQGIPATYKYMNDLYLSADRTKVKAVKSLVKDLNFKSAYIKVRNFYENNIEHPKLDELKKIVKGELNKNSKVKIIIFNHYRDSASKLVEELNSIGGVKCSLFVGQMKKGDTGMSQKEQIKILEDFSQGKYNVLLSTAIGEEGLDIPKVDIVIFYEPIPSAIRTIQRCLVKNTKILMNDNTYKHIQNIKKNDKVVTFNERTKRFEIKKVLECFKTKKREIIKIKTNLNIGLDLTSNHPVYTKKGWVEAKSIKEGSYIAIPYDYNQKEEINYFIELCPKDMTYVVCSGLIKKLVKKSKINYRKLAKAIKINEKSLWGYANKYAVPLKVFYKILEELNIPLNSVINKIEYIKSRKGNIIKINPKINKDFMWLCGAIATDGNYRITSKIRKNRNKPYYTHRFRVSNKNKKIIKKVEKILLEFNLKPHIENRKDGIYSIESTNTIIGHVLKRVGIPSKNKTRTLSISNDVFRMKKDNILSYIGGVFDGDGNIEPKQGKIRIGTSSQIFANKLQKLLLNCGYLNTKIHNKKIEKRNIKGRIANFNCDFYSLEFYKKHLVKKFIEETNSLRLKNKKIKQIFSKKSFYDDNFFWTKVKKIEKGQKEDVYNLHVYKNNNYIANNMLVHNCGRTARTEKGRVIVLVTKNTRDEAYRWTAYHKEKRMHKILSRLRDNISKNIEAKQQPTLRRFVDENKLKVFADFREKGSGVIKELINQGLDVRMQNLAVGDYILSNRVCVEFKTKQDFVNSLIDKRLLQQVKALKENFEKPLMIIEGEEDIYSVRKVHPNAISGMLASIVIDFGIPIVYTKNFLETVSLLRAIAKREQEFERKDIGVRTEKKPLTTKEQQEFIIESLPNVGPSLAKSLLKEFKSVRNVINAQHHELQKVEKLGPKKAEEIKRIVEEFYEHD